MAAERGLNAPLSSSAGRLFDAVAACLGICAGAQSYEGEAAMRLEALAEGAGEGYAMPFGDGVFETAPMIAQLLQDGRDGAPASQRAWRFHAGLAEAFAAQARALVAEGRAQAVALSGGCFQNALLLDLTVRALGDVPVLIHRRTPANDGSLALGQALVALAGLESR